MNSRNRVQQSKKTTFLAAQCRPMSADAARCHSSGFTIIELLVVIAIIGILAGMILYLTPTISASRVRKLVQAQMAQLITVIDAYKEAKGHYPPDNPKTVYPPIDPNGFGTNTLFYELTGNGQIGPAELAACGVDGILNGSDGSPTNNFHKSIKDIQFTNLGGLKLLMLKTKSPTGDYALWNYRTSKSETDSTMHNPHSYDLWVEVLVNGDRKTFGNWKEKE